MKIILTQEVPNLGAPGDLVEVKDGYGRNYLIPQGLGMVATRGGEKQVAQLKRARQARAVRDLDHANEIKAQLGSLRVRLSVRAGQSGRLFGSVTPADVADAVKAAGGPELDKRRLQLPSTIKSVGKHTVTVGLHENVAASFNVEVVASKK